MRLYSTLRYFALVAALIAAATSALAANDPLGLTPSSAANSLGIESNQDEFLRVEQAYQVNLRYQGDQQLLLDWQIEPGFRTPISVSVPAPTPSAAADLNCLSWPMNVCMY